MTEQLPVEKVSEPLSIGNISEISDLKQLIELTKAGLKLQEDAANKGLQALKDIENKLKSIKGWVSFFGIMFVIFMILSLLNQCSGLVGL